MKESFGGVMKAPTVSRGTEGPRRSIVILGVPLP